jgi:hypothetical protein
MKIKTYILIVSAYFPKYHPKYGQNTDFEQKIVTGDKRHTIRGNYQYWAPRIKEVAEGKAILIIRRWSGIPYKSKQIDIVRITKDNCPGVQQISMHKPNPEEIYWNIDDRKTKEQLIDVAKNDGLILEDFRRWFFPDVTKRDVFFEGIIIHFTKFRYK